MAGLIHTVGSALGGLAGRGARDFASGFFKASRGNDSDAQSRAPGGRREDTILNTHGPIHRPAGEPKSMFEDPYDVLGMMGYKERPSSVSYDTLRQILYRMPVLAVIIHTRVEQMAAFAQVAHDDHQIGFRVRLRDKKEATSRASRKMCRQFEQFILRTGVTSEPRKRDDFATYMRKVTKDALTFDQNCTEIVESRGGKPAAFYAVDAANVRIADTSRAHFESPLEENTAYVEVYDGTVRNEFSDNEMIFGVRNPTTDIRCSGYGTSELEMVLVAVTGLLNAWDFNAKAFSNGTMAKGILNIREENIPPAKMNSFERRWNALLRGEENAHRVPILNAKEGVDWINLQTGSDIMYREWMDWMVKVCTSAFSMLPEEINFRYGASGVTSTLSEDSNREKLIESRERGLRPLLRHFSANLNKYLIWPISEAVQLEFVGLDAMSPEEQADFNNKRCRTYMTVNEVRAECDLDPLPGMDRILDPTAMQASMAQPQDGGADPAAFGDAPAPLPGDGVADAGYGDASSALDPAANAPMLPGPSENAPPEPRPLGASYATQKSLGGRASSGFEITL